MTDRKRIVTAKEAGPPRCDAARMRRGASADDLRDIPAADPEAWRQEAVVLAPGPLPAAKPRKPQRKSA